MTSTINQLCVIAKIMPVYISCQMKRMFSPGFFIRFPISIKDREIKFICIVSGIRIVVFDCVFESICIKDKSIDWQEKLTDLVLMHYNETAFH